MSEPSERAAGKIVLVVDDDALFCIVMTGLLEIQGYRALVAADGAAALKLVEERRSEIGAVVVDWTMRPMNGRQILAQLRRISPELPVIMMSGSEKEDLPGVAEQGTLPGFLQKPFSSEKLARALREAGAAP